MCRSTAAAARLAPPIETSLSVASSAAAPVTEDVPLDLIETRTFGSRVIYERYGRARDESD